MAKSDALIVRSQGGKKGGYNRNKNRVIKKSDKVLFLFNQKPLVCIFNCQTGEDVYVFYKLLKLQSYNALHLF